MGDDLVKRLRDTPNWMREGFQDWKDNVLTYDRAPFEAADRIEQLESKLGEYNLLWQVYELDKVVAELKEQDDD